MEITSGPQPPRLQVDPYPWWLVLMLGIAATIIGIVLLINPTGTVAFFVQALGWFFFVYGIFSFISIFLDQRLWGWKLVIGGLGILAGLTIINNPVWSVYLIPVTLTWAIGAFGIAAGVFAIVSAIAGGGWGQAAVGTLAILLGIAMVVAPFVSTVAIIVATGILAIVGGVIVALSSFGLRSQQKARQEALEEAMRAIQTPPTELVREKGPPEQETEGKQ